MTDSPITSPGVDTFSSSSKAQLVTPFYPPPRSSSADSEQDSEFLDMDGESNYETDSEDAADVTVAAKDLGMQLLSSFPQAPFCSAEL